MMSRERFLNLVAVQEELDISQEEALTLISRGELAAVRILGNWRVERTALEQFIGRLYAEAAAALQEGAARSVLSEESVAAERLEVVDQVVSEPTDVQLGLNLTPQMLRVLRLVAEGMSNIEIADELSLEVSTIKSHVSRLLSRLNVPTRERLIAFAWRYGLVSGAPPVDHLRPGASPRDAI